MANLISTTGPVCPNVTDTPLDNRSRVSTIANIGNIPLAWKGMLVYCEENGNTYKITSLKPKTSGPVVIENYYPATWVEFGSGGGTPPPSPSPSAASAGDITYDNGGSYSTGTVGSKLNEIGNLNNLEISSSSIVGAINLLKQAVDGKISGVIVEGQLLPIDNGIVTIPAGGGGTGTITGATVGGNPVTESSGILKFDAYPTANTMQYSGSINYGSGTIGKEVKDLNESVNGLSTKVAELEADKPSPTPSSSITTVNLASYTTSGSSFTYDVDNKYIYNTKDTTFYQYSEEDNSNTVYYGVFKVIGEDRYLMYSITNNTTFTYVNTYTESTLPENAKKEFALGSVAVVKRVNGEGESWKNGTVNLFCTKQNMPLRNRCKNINFNGSTAWRVLIKSEDGNTIFVYKAKSNGNYEWEINVPRSSTANFNLLDKYFDRPDASNVSFDDSITQLGTQSNPVDNMQVAVEAIKSNCDSIIALRDVLQNKYDTLNATWTQQLALINRANTNYGFDDVNEFDNLEEYHIGDYVIYNDRLYKFTQYHTPGNSWNINEVEATSIIKEFIRNSLGDHEYVSYRVSSSVGVLSQNQLADLRLEVVFSDDNNTQQNLPSNLTGNNALQFDIDGYATFECPMGLFYQTTIVQISGATVLNQFQTPKIDKREARIPWRNTGQNLISKNNNNITGLYVVDQDGNEYPYNDFIDINENDVWTFDANEAETFKWIYIRDNNLVQNNAAIALSIDDIIGGYTYKMYDTNDQLTYPNNGEYDGKTNTIEAVNYSSTANNVQHAPKFAMSQYTVIGGNAYYGFIPSIKQLEAIINNRTLINDLLDKIRPTNVYTTRTGRINLNYTFSSTNAQFSHSMQCTDINGSISTVNKTSTRMIIIAYSY